MLENTARYISSTKNPKKSGSPPLDISLIMRLACDNGSSSMKCLSPKGLWSVEKKELQRNDMGIIMKLVYRGASV